MKKKTTDEYNYGKFRDYNTTSKVNIEYNKKHTKFFSSCKDPLDEKLFNFPKFVSRQSITYFICKYELFKKILPLHGSIVECGVLFGGGLMTFAQLSTIFEPVNYNRKIIGFDTFSGFPSISKKDKQSTSQFNHVGNLNANSYDDLVEAIKLYDLNRFVNHIPKIELIKGDATKTIPKYVKDNPQLVINLLYLDFDLYEPTKIALNNFLPRMTKGSIIAFDELNWKNWAGETEAVIDAIGLNKLKIERFTFGSNMSYAVLNEDP